MENRSVAHTKQHEWRMKQMNIFRPSLCLPSLKSIVWVAPPRFFTQFQSKYCQNIQEITLHQKSLSPKEFET